MDDLRPCLPGQPERCGLSLAIAAYRDDCHSARKTAASLSGPSTGKPQTRDPCRVSSIIEHPATRIPAADAEEITTFACPPAPSTTMSGTSSAICVPIADELWHRRVPIRPNALSSKDRGNGHEEGLQVQRETHMIDVPHVELKFVLP